MRDLLIRLLELPVWIKCAAGVILILAIVAAGITLYVTNRPIEWEDQPVMLRLLKGSVLVSDTQGGEFVTGKDNTWLSSGNCIEVVDNSTALLQYFDGSLVKIKGPAEIILTRSQSISGDDLNGSRAVSLNVSYGKIDVLAAPNDNRNSMFEVVTPHSVGVVEGTIFVVTVDKNGNTVWAVCEGVVRAACITGNSSKNAVVLLKPLSSCEAMFIPAVSIESPAEMTEDELLTITGDSAQMSSTKRRSDIKLEKITLIEKDDVIDFAAYSITGLTIPITISAFPEIPFDYERLEYDILSEGKYNIVLTRTPSNLRPIFPSLDAPDIWRKEQPDPIREEPPVYIGSIMGIDGPLGIAVDTFGNHICVTQSEGNCNTLVFDSDGNRIMTLAPPNTSPAERAPSYVAIDWTGIIYVSDRLRQTIDMYDEDSNYLGTFTPVNNPDISWSPLGLATDNLGNLYITDISGTQHRIIVCNSSGEQILEFGQSGTGPGSFSFPNDIAVDDSGRILVSDSNNQRIQVFSSDGTPLLEYMRGGGELSFPRGIDIDGRYVCVVDAFDHRINIYDMEQQMTPVFNIGGFGTGNGLFSYPNGIAVDSKSRIYVADRDNNRVQILGYEADMK